ncbi:MAG: HlyD family efflux transporter periplasmic adaptor subunit [Luteibacter sp.]
MDIASSFVKDRERRRARLIVAAAVLVVASVAVALWRMGPALPEAQRSGLWIDTVQRGDMLREVRATGVLAPRSSRWLASATPAQVQQILVWPGATVHVNTVLMRLANPEVEDNLANAQALLAAAEADVEAKRADLRSQALTERTALAQAQSDLASAKVKAEADEKAAKLQVIPRVQYEQGVIALEQLGKRVAIEQERVDGFAATMRAQIAAVEARAEQQRSTLLLRRRQADALDVKAGIDGVLQEVAVQEGAQVAIGANLARVARPDVLIARLQVPEVQAKDVAMGMPVAVDTHGGVVQGKVERIDPAVRSGSVQVDVALAGRLPEGARPDLSVDGRIRIALLHDVLSMGRPSLAEADGDIQPFRLEPDGGEASRVPVHLGAVSTDRVQVLRGLREGDRVIVSDTGQWDKYARLRVR